MLGLICVKYISDTFTARRAENQRLTNPNDEYFYADADADADIEAEPLFRRRQQCTSPNPLHPP